MPHKDPERAKAYRQERYQKNKVEIRAKVKAWRDAHKGYRQEYERQYRLANLERKNAYAHAYNASHRKERTAEGRAANAKAKEICNTIKLHYGCSNPQCKWHGEFSAKMLHFHHVDPKAKCQNLAKFQRETPRMYEEINKCCVLCSNCHALVTWHDLDASQFVRCNVTKGEIDERPLLP